MGFVLLLIYNIPSLMAVEGVRLGRLDYGTHPLSEPCYPF